MRRTIMIVLLTIPCLLMWSEDSKSSDVTLSSRVQRAISTYDDEIAEAKQKYLETVMDEQKRLRKKLERELDRLRLDDKQKEVVEKIVNSEDEKVREVLYTIATGDVKEAVAIRRKLKDIVENSVITDFLGNVMKPEIEIPSSNGLVGQWGMVYTQGNTVTHNRIVEIDSDLNITLIKGSFGNGTYQLILNEADGTYTGTGPLHEDTYNFQTLSGIRTNGNVTHTITIRKIK